VLLAVAILAVAGLTVAVVILATDNSPDTSAGSATQVSTPSPVGTTRYDGGPEEGTAALTQRSAPATFDPNSIKEAPGVRYDGGPEEGSAALTQPLTQRSAPATFDPNSTKEAPGVRYDGGPEEGTGGPVSLRAPITRYDGGPEEGSRGGH
jgi:hypothetical protein